MVAGCPAVRLGRSPGAGGCWLPREELATIKVALLGTGFGQVHAAVYARRADVHEVVVFGRTPGKLARINSQFGFATTTDLDALIADPSVDLVDICLPTRLHAEVAVRAMQAGRDVLIELPLAGTLEDARGIVAVQLATGRRAFVDMFSRFSPANQHLRQAVAGQRHGPLRALEIEGRTALLWEGYDLGLDTLALDMMHTDFDLVTGLLGRPGTIQVARPGGPGRRGSAAEVIFGYPGAHRPVLQFLADASALPNPRRLARHLHRHGTRERRTDRRRGGQPGHPGTGLARDPDPDERKTAGPPA